MKWAQERVDYCRRCADGHTKSLAEGLPQRLIDAWVKHKGKAPEEIEEWLRTTMLPALIKHCESEIKKAEPFLPDAHGR